MNYANSAFNALALNNLYGGSYSNVGRYYGGSPYAGYGGASLLNDFGIGLGTQQMRYDALPGAYGLGFGGGGIGGLGGLGGGLGTLALLGGLGGGAGAGMMIGFAAAQAVVGLITAFAGRGDNDGCRSCGEHRDTYNNFGNNSYHDNYSENSFRI